MSDSFFSCRVVKEIPADDGGLPVRFYRRTRLRKAATRRLSEGDIRELAGLGTAALASLVLPTRSLSAYSRFASGIRYGHWHKRSYAGFATAMRTVLGIDDDSRIETLFRSHVDIQQRRRMMFTVDGLARRKNPHIEFTGAEGLQTALGGGRGAIVWASQFLFQMLAGKRALWEQGFRPIQVSAFNHGLSRTAFGEAVINRPLRRAEDRYLQDRIVLDHDGGAAATRQMVDTLDRGGLVLLTNNFYEGSIFVEMRFGENGLVSMPTAPLSLVARRGTPFFSLAILETEPLTKLTAVVEPIDPGDRRSAGTPAGSRDYARMAQLALIARDQLFEQFRRAPDQLVGASGLASSNLGGPQATP